MPSDQLSNTTRRHHTHISLKRLFPHIKPHSFQHYRHYISHIQQLQQTSFTSSYITNLSSHTLTPHESSLLSKGLSFVPTPQHTHKHIHTALKQVHSIYNKHKYFRNHPYQGTTHHHPFHIKSNWRAPSDNSTPSAPTIHTFLSDTPPHTNPQDHNHTPTQNNITPDERTALQHLIDHRDITIKASDKGGGITILDTDHYIAQIHSEHLQDQHTYQELPSSPTLQIATDTNTLIDFLYTYHHIDASTAAYLRPPTTPRTPIFYGKPKTHKPHIPLRPICSAIDSPTDNLARYITHFLQPLATLTPSYIRDSITFKQFLQDIPALPTNAYLCTADVKSLYTNIPTHEAIKEICAFINLHRHTLPSYAPNTHVFAIILEHILEHSTFSFDFQHFLQRHGTAMGCRMAPPYANIFMNTLDATIHREHDLILYYKRFIDDIFFIFLGTQTEIDTLQTELNQKHPKIQFTLTHSQDNINFLDLNIYIDQDTRTLKTNLFRKPTDCQAYLHAHSNHPTHIKTGIIYAQALRLNTLIDNADHLNEHLDILARALFTQGYKIQDINTGFTAALQHTQYDLLHRTRQPAAHTYHNTVIVPFSHTAQTVKQFLHKHTTQQQRENTADNQPPQLQTIFSRHRNLRDLLTHSNVNYRTPHLD